MTINEIMEIFKDPNAIGTLSSSDKMMAVGFTMILGMGITFVSLIILKYVIEGMAKALEPKKVVAPKTVAKTVAPAVVEEEEVAEVDDKALVAVITATLAMQLKTSVSNIRIRNIRKVGGNNSTWNQVGLIEQISNRL